eukprot:gene7483-628_t
MRPPNRCYPPNLSPQQSFAPAEQMRESQREIRKGTREIEREIFQMKREEQKLIQEIKGAAKMGNQQSVRILAKSLVRVKGQVSKLQASIAQLKGVGTQMTTAAATSTLANAVGSTTKTMQAMNQATNPQKTHQQMQAFAKENEKMNMTTEMMDDAMDNAFDTEETEEETDTLVSQILDEIGIDIAASAPQAGRTRLAQQKQEEADSVANDEREMDELNARLANIKSVGITRLAQQQVDSVADDEKDEVEELAARLANMKSDNASARGDHPLGPAAAEAGSVADDEKEVVDKLAARLANIKVGITRLAQQQQQQQQADSVADDEKEETKSQLAVQGSSTAPVEQHMGGCLGQYQQHLAMHRIKPPGELFLKAAFTQSRPAQQHHVVHHAPHQAFG